MIFDILEPAFGWGFKVFCLCLCLHMDSGCNEPNDMSAADSLPIYIDYLSLCTLTYCSQNFICLCLFFYFLLSLSLSLSLSSLYDRRLRPLRRNISYVMSDMIFG